MKSTIKVLGFVTITAIIGLMIVACATFGIGDPLPPPENVRLTQTVGPRTITVTWDKVEGATEYVVRIAGLGNFTVEKETKFTLTSTERLPIRPATNYEVRVAANKKAIKGEGSPGVTLTTLPATPAERLPVPSNVTATANAWNSVTVRWGASTGATGYRVTQGTNTWTVTGTSHTVTNLNGDTSYSFVVTPLVNNDAGTSARAVSVRTPMSPQQQAAAEQRAAQQAAAAAEREAQAAAEAARIAALNSNANFQRLIGSWHSADGYITIPNNADSDAISSMAGGGGTIRGKIQTVTANQVVVGDNRTGFTFNYSISGNTLTVTNFTTRAGGFTQASPLRNVTYTKR